jgi:hypothetical protein
VTGDVFGQKTSRVAGSNISHLAPSLDFSSLDTWLSALHMDCSMFHAERPVLLTDISALNT